MPASYTSGQPSNPRRHPTCWASSQWGHTISRTPCHGAWTSDQLSAHPSNECCCTAPQIETPLCTRRTATHQLLWQQQHTCGAVGGSSMDCGVGGQPHKVLQFHPRHRHPPPPAWPSQEGPGSCLTTSAPVSDVSAPASTNRVWPPLRPVSVVQKNKPSTMSSSNVQSIDLPMDYTAWRFWTVIQPNGCSTPPPKSSAAKQGCQIACFAAKFRKFGRNYYFKLVGRTIFGLDVWLFSTVLLRSFGRKIFLLAVFEIMSTF